LKNCFYLSDFIQSSDKVFLMSVDPQIVFDFDLHGLCKVKEFDSDEKLSNDRTSSISKETNGDAGSLYSAYTSEPSDDCICDCTTVTDKSTLNKYPIQNSSGAERRGSEESNSHIDNSCCSCLVATNRVRYTLSEKIIIVILSLTILFFLLELVSGFLLHSLTILADAWHMAGDAMALISGLIAISLSHRKENDIVSFGWQRTQVIGAFGNGIFLFAVCFITICDAITGLIQGVDKIKEPLYMLIVGVVGLGVNIIGLGLFQYYRYVSKQEGGKPRVNLHSHSHSHSHGHSHGHGHSHNDHDNDDVPIKKETESNTSLNLEEGRLTVAALNAANEESIRESETQHSHGDDLNMRGIFLHILGDALGSIVVIGASLLNMYLDSPYVSLADPICSIIFSLFIAKSAFGLLRDSVHILMQSVPKEINMDNIRKDLLKIAHVHNVHELHVWQISQGYNIATVHISTRPKTKHSVILNECRKVLCNYHIHRSAIQIEKRS